MIFIYLPLAIYALSWFGVMFWHLKSWLRRRKQQRVDWRDHVLWCGVALIPVMNTWWVLRLINEYWKGLME